MSIDDATPEEWNKARKNTTATGKLFHPQEFLLIWTQST